MLYAVENGKVSEWKGKQMKDIAIEGKSFYAPTKWWANRLVLFHMYMYVLLCSLKKNYQKFSLCTGQSDFSTTYSLLLL